MSLLRNTTIDDIKVLKPRGPWASKSGGQLNVLFNMNRDEVESFLDYDNSSFADVAQDIRGLRTYTVSDIPKDSIGGKEWHMVRTEFLHALSGAVVLECVDLDGKEIEHILDGAHSVIIPPRILHTYQALRDKTCLQVVANTLFLPEDPMTHDTYSVDTFK